MKLHGLTTDVVAGLLGSYGLFEVMPDCRIRWVSDNNGATYYPEIESSFKTAEDLAAHLLKEETWRRLHLIERDGNRFTIEEFTSLFDRDPEMALAIANDQVVEQKGDTLLVKKSPLLFLRRCTSYKTSLAYTNSEHKKKPYYGKLRVVTEKPEDLAFNMTHDYSQWRLTEGNGMGFFPFEMFRAYRHENAVPERVTGFVMLCLIAMRNMTTYYDGQMVTIPGIYQERMNGNGRRGKPYLYLPIWDRWFDRDDYKTWMLYPELWRAEVQNGLKKYGIAKVMRCGFLKGAKGYGFEALSSPV
jgi:hypothetical protein